MSKDPFNVPVNDYLGKPLYCYNLDDSYCEDEVLRFINAHYKDFKEGSINSERRRDQTDNFAAYLGFSDSIGRDAYLTDSGPVYNNTRKPNFKRLRTHPIKYLTDELVSRFIRNKPNFQVFTANRNILEEKKKIHTANKVTKSIFADPINNNKFKEFVRQAVIFAESYMEVFWNVDKGPRSSTKKIELLGGDGMPVLDGEGHPIELTKQLNIGDYDIKLWDPRFVITQKADDFSESEWTILVSYKPVEKVRLDYPEKAADIKATPGLDDIEASTMHYREYHNHALVYKLYHRPTPEMPEGRIIEATPDVVLRNTKYPHPSLTQKGIFPIIQLRSVKAIGSERGVKSIVSQGKALQLAKSNLMNLAIRNLISFPPIRVWEGGSVDGDKLRFSVPTDVTLKRSGGQPPHVLTTQSITNEQIELMKMIDEDLHKIFTVSPVSIGETLPNMRSRSQMDFVTEQESQQTFPIEDDIRDSLILLAQAVIAIVADEYEDGDERRLIRYFGDRNKLLQEDFDPSDLKETFDIRVDTVGRIADTLGGKIQAISNMVQLLPPGTFSSNWVIDKLEIGASDEVLNTISGGPELARRHVSQILEGKAPKSPQKWLDLVPYYEELMKKLQTPEILEILDDSGYEYYLEKLKGNKEPEKVLKGKELLAFRILDQVSTTESLLLDTITQQEAKGVIDPTTGMSVLRSQIITKVPAFPTVYVSDSRIPIDPMTEPTVPQVGITDPGMMPPPEEGQIPQNMSNMQKFT
jgi:hypothetical protein